jgi:DNA (cytosine-5)-methyltransferase 1
MAAHLTSIDLFSGCGGFTLGLAQAGVHTLAAIDASAQALAVFRSNLPEVPHVLERDLTRFHPAELQQMIGRDALGQRFAYS